MIYGSVCSGIEAATVAWHPLGWRPAFFSEIESFPCALLKHYYPDVPNHGDMTKFKDWPDATLDVLVGGTPCQAFSVAGLRKGLDDPRGNLTLVYLAIAAKYRPKWVVWENVPGVLSDGTGAFGAFLGGLAELGYGFAYRVLDAQYFGVPQRRRRVFVVGCLGDWRAAAAVLFERESLRGDSPPSRKARQRTPYAVSPSLTSSGRGVERTGESRGQDCVIVEDTVSRCLNAGGMGRQDWETETLIAHSLRADGFDASEDGTGRGTPLVACREVAAALTTNYGKQPDNSDTALGPNLIAFVQNQRDEVREMEIAGALAGELGMKQQTYIAFSSKDHGADAGDTAPTLRAMGHARSHANAGGQVAVAFTVSDKSNGFAWEKEISPTLDATAGRMTNQQYGVRQNMQVRRLTPRECDRLQGFPDDYTLIQVRGKPAADGPRYKALGNSMAVPVMRWIGERIQLSASLYD